MTGTAKSNTLRRMSAPLLREQPAAAERANALPQASATVRIALFFYLLLIVYASCYPFSGWHDNGLSPWGYLLEPLPRYWTGFDLAVNALGYMPLGALAVLALYPRLTGAPAALAGGGAGLLLAATLECLQNYLPSRVPSNLDLMTNACGALAGALAGWLLATPVLQRSRLRSLRAHWFSDQASRGLIVVALWPLAQIFPQPYLFGHGQWLPMLSDGLSSLLETPVDIGTLIWQSLGVGLGQFLQAEVVITAFGMTGALLTLMCQMRAQAPRALLALGLLLAALTVKSLAHAVLFAPGNAFSWITPSSGSGLLVGAVMLGGLSFAPALAQRRAAIFALATGLVLLNLLPSNPYFQSTLQAWVQGKFLNFNGAAQFLSLSWPLFALWFLTHSTHRGR
jgi:VanZ family protein